MGDYIHIQYHGWMNNKLLSIWMGFMHSCTTSWTSASSLFPVCYY